VADVDAIASLAVGVEMPNGPAVTAQLDQLAAAGARAEAATNRLGGATDGLTAAQRFLVQNGLQLDAVLARVNGETAALGQQEQLLSNRYEENRAIVLQHMRALEMDAAAQNAAGAAAGVHGLQLGRVNMELGTAIGRFAGVNTAATRFAAMLGGAVTGYGVMIAISLAIVGAVKAYEALTEATRKAREEQEKATQALKDWYDTETRGVAGERQQQLVAAQATLARLTAQYTQLEVVADPTHPATGREPNVVRQQRKQAADDAAKIKTQMDALRAEIAAGQADVTKTLTQANIDQQAERERNLEAIVKSNAATAAERAKATAQLKRDLAEDTALMHQYLASGNPALAGPAAGLAGNIDSITNAFRPTKDQLQTIRKEAQATTDTINSMVKALDGLRKKGSVQYAAPDMTAQIGDLAKMLDAAGPKIERLGDANEKATDKATAAWEKATIKAATYAEEIQKIGASLQTDLVGGIENFATHSLRSFESFATTGASLSHKMVTDITKDLDDLSKKLAVALVTGDNKSVTQLLPSIQQLQAMQKVAGEISAGFSGLSAGAQFGNMVHSASGGAALGAAAGAGQGFATAGPMGALIGGISGLVSGFLSGASAAEQMAQSIADMQRQFKITITTMNEAAGAATSLDVALAKLAESTQQAFAQAIDANGISGTINGKTKQDWEQIQKDAATTAAILKDQFALEQKTTTESLQARLLRAQGNTIAADAMDLQVQQQEERAKLLNSYGLTSDATAAQIANLTATQQATLALLDQVQAQEKIKAATDALTNANENLVQGYKLNLELFKYSPALGPGASPFVPQTPTPVPQGTGPTITSGRPSPANRTIVVPVTLTVDGKVVATTTVTHLETMAQAQYGDSSRWSEVTVQ